MVSSPKTFDASKSGKMTELTKTKYRFGILVGFTHNIACQTGFENSTGNTIDKQKSAYRPGLSYLTIIRNRAIRTFFLHLKEQAKYYQKQW